jgi:hypothetical protein
MRNFPGLFAFAVAIVALPAFVPAQARAQDAHLRKTVEAATSVVIRGYWRSDKNCAPVQPAPVPLLDKPPEHGVICFRHEGVTVHNVLFGNMQQCVGRQIPGINVVYQSWPGYSGLDEARYTVVFPRGRHTVLVDLTVLPVRGLPPADEQHQPPGPMPECAALVS